MAGLDLQACSTCPEAIPRSCQLAELQERLRRGGLFVLDIVSFAINVYDFFTESVWLTSVDSHHSEDGTTRPCAFNCKVGNFALSRETILARLAMDSYACISHYPPELLKDKTITKVLPTRPALVYLQQLPVACSSAPQGPCLAYEDCSPCMPC